MAPSLTGDARLLHIDGTRWLPSPTGDVRLLLLHSSRYGIDRPRPWATCAPSSLLVRSLRPRPRVTSAPFALLVRSRCRRLCATCASSTLVRRSRLRLLVMSASVTIVRRLRPRLRATRVSLPYLGTPRLRAACVTDLSLRSQSAGRRSRRPRHRNCRVDASAADVSCSARLCGLATPVPAPSAGCLPHPRASASADACLQLHFIAQTSRIIAIWLNPI